MSKNGNSFLKDFINSFPLQLVLLHIKRNHLLLVFWVLIFALTAGWIGRDFGINSLILSPEYLNHSGFMAYLITGISVGGLIVGFNLYSYILHAYRFRFIATVPKPFLVFSYNNFILPLLFVLFYLITSYNYQSQTELKSVGQTFFNLSGFLIGLSIFIILAYAYFIFTNINIFKLRLRKSNKAFQTSLHRSEAWTNLQQRVKPWKVSVYIQPFFKIKPARATGHYKNEWIDEILAQNHINASFFEIVAVLSFFMVGALGNSSRFMIPAAASTFLFITIIFMLTSAFYSWFRGWTMTVLVSFALLLNALSGKIDFLNINSHALGLNYNTAPGDYSNDSLKKINTSARIKKDHEAGIKMLESRVATQNIASDSLLIFINVSGGGLRSTAWVFNALSQLDSITRGELYKHTVLITGSSGGMIGAAYWREIAYRNSIGFGEDLSFNKHFKALTSDLLNPIIFSLVGNDLSFRFRKSIYQGKTYANDRAFAFEKQLNNNTMGYLDKHLADYYQPEKTGQMPLLILSPTILNDGRRLLISSQPIAYLTAPINNRFKGWKTLSENVEFRSLFMNQDADSLRFLSGLRMNATFPYILPSVTLPSEPEIEIMDAGIRDNFGLLTSYRFFQAMQPWFQKNTRKVVFIQIRDQPKIQATKPISPTVFNRITLPFDRIYGNFGRVQEYTQELLFKEDSPLENPEME